MFASYFVCSLNKPPQPTFARLFATAQVGTTPSALGWWGFTAGHPASRPQPHAAPAGVLCRAQRNEAWGDQRDIQATIAEVFNCAGNAGTAAARCLVRTQKLHGFGTEPAANLKASQGRQRRTRCSGML